MIKNTEKRIRKYFQERELKGKTQEEAEAEAYNTKNNHGTRIENTKTYQKQKQRYADVLAGKITLEEIAEIQARNARQEKDKGASNTAIKTMLDKLEPQEPQEIDTGDVIIKISKNN